MFLGCIDLLPPISLILGDRWLGNTWESDLTYSIFSTTTRVHEGYALNNTQPTVSNFATFWQQIGTGKNQSGFLNIGDSIGN